MHKKITLVLVSMSLSGLLTAYFWNAYELISRSYYVDETRLYKVDTFHLSRRAYDVLDGPQARGRFDSQIRFESVDGYSFAINGNIYKAINDKERLEDTLMYNDTKFTIFTDEEHYQRYLKSKKPIFIRVYQIQIGNKEYVDITEMNKISKGEIMRGIIIPPAFIFFLGFLIFKKPEWWTRRNVSIWSVTFFLTIIGLLLLT